MTGKTNTILLWVGIVTNKYGANTYVAVSEDALRDELFEYVKAWWPEEIADLPLPLDRDQAIEVYFEKVESETCVIDSAILSGDFKNLSPVNKSDGLVSRLERISQTVTDAARELLELPVQDQGHLDDAALTLKEVADQIETAVWIVRSDNN